MGIEESKIALDNHKADHDPCSGWVSVWIRSDEIRIIRVMNYNTSDFISMQEWCEENCKTFMFGQISIDGSNTFSIFRFSTEYGEELAKEEAAWFKMRWQ